MFVQTRCLWVRIQLQSLNTYHSKIEMKPVDVESSTYIDIGITNNEKYPIFKVGDHVRTLNDINIFAKNYHQIGLKFLLSKKLKIVFRGHILLLILTVTKLLVRVIKTNWKRQIKQFRI